MQQMENQTDNYHKNLAATHIVCYRVTATEKTWSCHYRPTQETLDRKHLQLFELTIQSENYDSQQEITWSVFKHDLMSLSAFSHNANRVVRSVLTSSCLVIWSAINSEIAKHTRQLQRSTAALTIPNQNRSVSVFCNQTQCIQNNWYYISWSQRVPYIHCVSKKTRHQTLAHNFPKC